MVKDSTWLLCEMSQVAYQGLENQQRELEETMCKADIMCEFKSFSAS